MADPLFLLDSNICIYILGDAEGAATLRLGQCAPGSVVTSAIAYGEVLRGLADPESRAFARRLFALVPPIPFDREAAHAYMSLPFRRASYDRLIAAHAIALGLILVTNNERDFADIAGLRLANWTLPA